MFKKYIGFVILLIFSGALLRCATVSSPGGGPRDSLSPIFISSSPKPYQTNFKGNKATLTFNEYVQLKDQQKLFFMSPPADKKPYLNVKGKSVVVDFQEPLDSNSTYRLDFGSSIADNNEGNRMDNFSLVFSTGDFIDSLIMAGQVIDSYTRDTAIGAYLFYFDSKADSVTLDSTMFKSRAEALFRADSSGYFYADILKDKDYRLYAMLDKNDNQRYEAGVDKVAFLDSVYNPTKLPEFSFSIDEKGRLKLDSLQALLEVFKEETRKRQTIVEHKRPLRQKLNIVFNARDAILDSLVVDSIEDDRLYKVWNKTKDSLTIWITGKEEEDINKLKDTIKVRIAYQRPDSVWNYKSYGQNLNFIHKLQKETVKKKAFQANTQDKPVAKRKKRGRKVTPNPTDTIQQDTLNKDILSKELSKKAPTKDSVDNDSTKTLNPFKITVKASKEFVPIDDLRFEFEYPLHGVDQTKITLLKYPKITRKGKLVADEKATGVKVPFKFEQDSLDILKYSIQADWDEEIDYELVIPEKIFQNIAFQANDTLKAKFTVMPRSKFGTITLNPIIDSNYNGNYIIQLLPPQQKQSGENQEDKDPIVKQLYITNPKEKVKFEYLPVGKYRLRVIQDRNINKKWDTGDLVKRIKPEKSRLYFDKFGKSEIISKENWEIEIDVNYQTMFEN